MIYFDESDFKIKASKYCYLRAVQFKLDKVICDYIRGPISEAEAYAFLKSRPSNITDLIDFLYSKNLLPNLTFDDKEILKRAYSLSLMYVHIAQNLCEALKRPIEIPLDDSQIAELEDYFNRSYQILQKIQ